MKICEYYAFSSTEIGARPREDPQVDPQDHRRIEMAKNETARAGVV